MIAVALSPQARALIQAHREAGRPTQADRQRVTAALRARLGSAVLPLERPIRDRWMSNITQHRTAAALGLCVVGSALLLARRPATALSPALEIPHKSAEAALSSTVTAASGPSAASEALVQRPPEMAVAAPRPPAPKLPARAPDTLAQEVLLLSSATSQLSSGQAAVALKTLEQHQRRFSHGALSEERNAAKARALCMLHRQSEGRATLALLAAGSPIAARVNQDCDSAP